MPLRMVVHGGRPRDESAESGAFARVEPNQSGVISVAVAHNSSVD